MTRSAWVRTTRHRPGSKRLDIGPGPNDSTSARPRWLHISLPQTTPHWPGSLGSISSWARSSRHRPGRAPLNIGPGPNDSASTRARTNPHRPEPTQLNISPGPLDSTSARAHSARHQTGIAQLDIGLCLERSTLAQARSAQHWPGLGSTSTRTCSARHQPCLDIGTGVLDSISDPKDSARHGPGSTRIDIGMGPLDSISTLTRVDSISPTQFDLAKVDSARLWPEMTWLDFCPYRLDSTWARTTQLDVDLSRLCSTYAWIVLTQPGLSQFKIQSKMQFE